jgi:hypothetical protein
MTDQTVSAHRLLERARRGVARVHSCPEGSATTGTFTTRNAGGTADVIIDVMGSYGPLTSHVYNGDSLRSSRTTTASAQYGVGVGWSQTLSQPSGQGARGPHLSVGNPGAGAYATYCWQVP